MGESIADSVTQREAEDEDFISARRGVTFFR